MHLLERKEVIVQINSGELQGHQLHLKMVSRRIVFSQERCIKHCLQRRVKFQRARWESVAREEQWKFKKKYYV